MRYNFNIEKIIKACFVLPEKSFVNTNRLNHGLAFHTTGTKTYYFKNGEKFVVNKNDIIYLPKHSNYEVIADIPGECYAISFEVSEEVSFKPFVIRCKNSNSVLEHFKSARNVWKKKKTGYEMKCKSELYDILYTLQQEHLLSYIHTSKHLMIQDAVNYIHNNYTNELLSISALAEMCNITPEYFRAIFKNFYGVSPLEYINNLKINHAKEMLESDLFSVTEAALSSGFSDISHFSRVFKKVTQYSPTEYKRIIQN